MARSGRLYTASSVHRKCASKVGVECFELFYRIFATHKDHESSTLALTSLEIRHILLLIGHRLASRDCTRSDLVGVVKSLLLAKTGDVAIPLAVNSTYSLSTSCLQVAVSHSRSQVGRCASIISSAAGLQYPSSRPMIIRKIFSNRGAMGMPQSTAACATC